MIALALGLLAAGGLAWAVNAFARAPVADIKALLAWVAALAGVILAVLLLLSGRGAVALLAGVPKRDVYDLVHKK